MIYHIDEAKAARVTRTGPKGSAPGKEKKMKSLVVYDSQFGNTEKVALAIADALREFGQAQAVHADPSHPIELSGVDLLVVGGPTQNMKATAGIRAFVDKLSPTQLSALSVACFDTRYRQPQIFTGSAADALAKNLAKIGVSPIAPAESFFVSRKSGPLVDGELDRASAWARSLANTAMGTSRVGASAVGVRQASPVS